MKLIVITGPTASGKSSLGERLARELRGEIINADSVQVYSGLDIGSAKPSAEMCREIRHHVLSIIPPCSQFDAGMYVKLADEAVADVISRGKLPIVVGGSGLYVRALLHGLAAVPEVPDSVRSLVQLKSSEISSAAGEKEQASLKIHEWLAELDRNAARRISYRDAHRVQRAIEVALSSKQTLTEHHEDHRRGAPRYDALIICLLPAREILYPRLDKRVEQMFADGLEWEVKGLRENFPNFASWCDIIGYRHVNNYFDGLTSKEEMIELMKRDTRRFAKRQFTWWRHEPERMGWLRVKNFAGYLESDRSTKSNQNGSLGGAATDTNVSSESESVACPNAECVDNPLAKWSQTYKAHGALSQLINDFLYAPIGEGAAEVRFLSQ